MPSFNTAPLVPTSYQQRAIELSLAVGSFAIGTGEFSIMGLLPDVAEHLGIDVPTAGHVISSYALGVVIGSPIIAILAARMPRRALLLVLMALFALGNIASALANSYSTLMIARFLSGVPHGAYFGVACLVAASMVPAGQRAQAVGRVMLGLTVATLVGTPFATWMGQNLGWQSTFHAVGGIGLLTVLLLWMWLPHSAVAADASPLRELGALRRKQVWLTLGVAAVGSGGMFAVFSYIVPTIINQTGLSAGAVPFVLTIFGLGMVLGNIIGPRLGDRALMPTIAGVLVWNLTVPLVFYFIAGIAWATIVSVLFIGMSFALGPTIQTRLMDVAEDAQTLAATLNHSAFNIANALGAWLGGVTIAAGFAWSSTGLVGSALAAGGLVLFLYSWHLDRTTQATTRTPSAG
jgi:DHA1 family inner membrane transport protein